MSWEFQSQWLMRFEWPGVHIQEQLRKPVAVRTLWLTEMTQLGTAFLLCRDWRSPRALWSNRISPLRTSVSAQPSVGPLRGPGFCILCSHRENPFVWTGFNWTQLRQPASQPATQQLCVMERVLSPGNYRGHLQPSQKPQTL